MHEDDEQPWWAMPVETRWKLLNWPGWSRLVMLVCFFAALNWMIFAPAGTFKDVHRFLAHQDKIAHCAIFLTLAWLVRWSLPGDAVLEGATGWQRYGVPAALVLYACSTEVLQPLIGGSGRTFEWLDMASNLTGICTGWLLFNGAIAGTKDRFTKRIPADSLI